METGGAGRDRTGDLLNANQALSQLSYSPSFKSKVFRFQGFLVGLGRLELPTSPLSGVRSNHLSYRPVIKPSLMRIEKFLEADWTQVPTTGIRHQK